VKEIRDKNAKTYKVSKYCKVVIYTVESTSHRSDFCIKLCFLKCAATVNHFPGQQTKLCSTFFNNDQYMLLYLCEIV